MAGKSKPGIIHLRIIEVMKKFPNGVSGGQIREELDKEGLEPGEHTHRDPAHVVGIFSRSVLISVSANT